MKKEENYAIMKSLREDDSDVLNIIDKTESGEDLSIARSSFIPIILITGPTDDDGDDEDNSDRNTQKKKKRDSEKEKKKQEKEEKKNKKTKTNHHNNNQKKKKTEKENKSEESEQNDWSEITLDTPRTFIFGRLEESNNNCNQTTSTDSQTNKKRA